MTKRIEKLDRPPPLHRSVQDTIKIYIRDNALQAGDPLLPETELARQLGVSRNSVREAVKALESMGILETRRGSGVYVREFSFEPLLNNLPYGLMGDVKDLAELLEIRQVLELAKIAAAIDRLTHDQLADFDEILEGMSRKAERGESFPEEDRRFHRLLFQNLGNRMLLGLIDVFWLAASKAAQHVAILDPQPLRTYRDHVAIVEAIKTRDVESASLALDRHYDGIRARLQEIPDGGGSWPAPS